MGTQRAKRVAEEMKKEISTIIRDEVKDPAIGFLTVTSVELSRDLSDAKIFISIYGTEEEKNATMEALKRASGFIRKGIGARIRLHHVPVLHFVYDESIEHGTKINKLLSEIDKSHTEN